MEIKQTKTVSRKNDIITMTICGAGLLFCCYCGIFVFPWGANGWIMALGITFLCALAFGVLKLGTHKSWLSILILAVICVPSVFGIAALRDYYSDSQLDKYGVVTSGEVVSLFKDRRGRYGTKKVDMAKIAYRAGDTVVYNNIENKKRYINVHDRVKLIYSSKDPDIFSIMKIDNQASRPTNNLRGVPTPVTFIDAPPQFPGDMPALYAYLADNVAYPQQAKDQGIKGKVFVSFVITGDGSVADVKVEKGIGGGCDEAAIEAITNMPKWKPGIQNGKTVRVKYNIPISFSL